MRASLILISAAISATALGQDSAAKFSFTAQAGSAKSVFERLSKAAGTNLVAAGQVANDVILLDLKDVTLSDAMSKIAQALNGEWRKEGLGWVFYRGSNFEAADQRAENAARVADFRQSLATVLEAQSKTKAFDDDAAKKLADAQRKLTEEMSRQAGTGNIRISGDFGTITRQTPAARAITNLLAKMSDSQIALLMSGNRLVFSLKPTRMQKAMPNGANNILRQFIKESAVYRDVMQRNAPPDTGETRQIVVNGFGADGMGDGDPSLGIGYALLVNQPSLGSNNVNVSLIIADPNGKTIASGQFFVGPTASRSEAQPPTNPSAEKPIALSPLALEMAKLVGQTGPGAGGARGAVRVMAVASGSASSTFRISGGGDGKTPTMSADLRAKVLQPEQFDPLSFAPGELIAGIAKARGKNLVAYVPDTAFMPLNQLAIGNATPTLTKQSAERSAGLKFNEDAGWLIVSPVAPSTSRNRSVNRMALGKTLRLLDAKGFLSLDDWAAFASNQSKAPRFNELDELYLRFINSPAADEGLGQFSFAGGWQMLQFYASMSTSQRQALMRSGQVPLNTLSQAQIALVSDQVFNGFEGPSVDRPQEQGRRIVLGDQSVASERTYLLPNGIPRNGFLRMSSQVQEVVQAGSSQGGGEKFMTADSLAFERVRAERPELISFGAAPNYDRYRMGSQRTFSFRFQFTPEVSLSRQLEDNSPGNQAFSTFDRLPANFRRRVDQLTEQLKRSWGPGRGNQIPPPAN